MRLKRTIGLFPNTDAHSEKQFAHYINLKLAALGCPTALKEGDPELDDMTASLLSHVRETDRLLCNYFCPTDRRIQDFLNVYLIGVHQVPTLPHRTFVLDFHGLARRLSLPPDRSEFRSDVLHSYRVKQGVLHNPRSDRRTTQGIFHIVEGGMSIPDDKLGVPKRTFAYLLGKALTPPPDLLRLPFTSSQEQQAECFVSLLLRPIVVPSVPGIIAQKSMETRFFAPGGLVSNLDFVESIFGNAGDPFLPENDAGLDAEHWTGHTGCVILAPHLTQVTKKEAGLPPRSKATPRQIRDGMFWDKEGDLYNNGGAFKLACRDHRGVMVTIIADNYFGYCKKEVKTQVSYSANLYGMAEEEHAGGALVYPSYDLGEEFSGHLHLPKLDYTFSEVLSMYGEVMDAQPEGYAVDKKFPDIVYVPENVRFDLNKLSVSWAHPAGDKTIKLLPGKVYVRPSGYKVHMEKAPDGKAWRLIGTVAEGTFCHKPCTVSGGGKSEISKPITDAILVGPVFVANFKHDFDLVADLINRDYGARFKKELAGQKDSRPILSPGRSLGSVIKLLTPASREYTAKYNTWLATVPQYIKEMVFVVKRFYKPSWGENWREHFSVDIVNGRPGNELKCDNRKIMSYYLRVGFEQDGAWRTFGLRKDFHASAKWAMEDDISASVVVPADRVPNLNKDYSNQSVKFVQNCEYRLFQRPDDAVHRGYDKLTEADFARDGNFFSNYEPLKPSDARDIIEDTIGLDKFTPPMQQIIREAAAMKDGNYFVSSAHPRIVDGVVTKNPRYLQTRPDLLNPREVHLAEMATRLQRRVPANQPIYNPVHAVLPGRRNNPPDAKIRSLAVYNPIHYMELPELFMEFICSMTGKSPSTTGAGSEGALTKGPFNALPPIIDLNNALTSYLLTGYDGFVTAAGYVGPNYRVDHDISLLVPEIWCRMSAVERDPEFLIRNGYLEKCEDMEVQGKKVLHSRLGYRITARFVRTYFGRVFNSPHIVFTEAMLRPETQSKDIFADGMANIVETQERVAQAYFDDGGIQSACPPLKSLLQIMAKGKDDQGRGLADPTFRKMFTRDSLLQSGWYAERLQTKQKLDQELWRRHVKYLETFSLKEGYTEEVKRLGIEARLKTAREMLEQTTAEKYLESLRGTIGANPSEDSMKTPAGD
jgi:hypothetical protein